MSDPTTPRGRRAWYDYAGFLAFLGLVVWNFERDPVLLLLLAPTLGFDTVTAFTFLTRDARVRRDPRWWAQLAAYAGSFAMPFATALLSTYWPDSMRRTENASLLALGIVLWMAGGVLKIWPLWHLRRAFSIEPAARRLVTSGPYRWARHPIYVSHTLVYLGLLLQRPTVPLAAVTVLWFVMTLVRVHAEDRVLAAAFPEHAAYRARVGAFGPRLTR
jgi:protein-S-isoprenylcysteine O-methyltransferase Ste14